MDWAKLDFLCEASRTVERFGLLGGKLNMPDKYLDVYCHHLVIIIFNLEGTVKLFTSFGYLYPPLCDISNLILWEPMHGETVRGGQSLTYIDQIQWDTGPGSTAEMKTCMEDRVLWLSFVARGGDDDGDDT